MITTPSPERFRKLERFTRSERIERFIQIQERVSYYPGSQLYGVTASEMLDLLRDIDPPSIRAYNNIALFLQCAKNSGLKNHVLIDSMLFYYYYHDYCEKTRNVIKTIREFIS